MTTTKAAGLGSQSWQGSPDSGIKTNTEAKVSQLVPISNVRDDTWLDVAFALDDGNVQGYKDGGRFADGNYLPGKGSEVDPFSADHIVPIVRSSP